MTIDESAARPDRIATLDVIRGAAVMGILLMNIVAFAMPEAAYSNPAAYGGHSGTDLAAWALNFIFIDGKMRGLFSFLFGASMLLVIERATAKGEDPARVHFSRMFWLFLFGEAHLILLWWGDILHHYALIGCAAWFFRKLEPHKLVALAIMLIAVELWMVGGMAYDAHNTVAAMQVPHPGAAAITAWQGLQNDFGVPSASWIRDDLALHRGPYAALLADNLSKALPFTGNSLLFVGAETLGYMLLGMACLKSGLLTGAWSSAAYRRLIVIGFGVGVPVSAALAWYIAGSDFAAFSVVLGGVTLPALVRPLMIIGWACLIALFARRGGAPATRIAAAGRMAFSNYIGTSMLCTSLFYGYGFGLYGKLSRAELYLVVVGVWALMLLWSKLWLTHFRYGPLEWLWRSLARLHFQPMRGGAFADR